MLKKQLKALTKALKLNFRRQESISNMKLIVGLGNPGEKYSDTRHNVGFMAVDFIHRHFAFGAWKEKFKGEFVKGSIDGEDTILLKPYTFMNLSGESVGAACKFFKIKPENVYVIYDELDLKPNQIKLKQGGGAAGHNGIKSLDQHLSGKNYHKMRIGIGHPGNKHEVSGYVLRKAPADEFTQTEKVIETYMPRLPALLSGDGAKFLNPNEPL